MPNNAGRMLVVDDNRINRMLLERALGQQGYSVATAENGRQALERLAAEPFDIVLLDVLMPELDGYETLARIKGDDALRHIPVIMISAVEELDSVVRCIEMGAADYLTKPFNPALLRARLNASLAEKRLRDLEREYLEQVGYVADAAAQVQAGRFDPASLDLVAARGDALGQLARVFQHMANEVHLREQRLRQQLRQLHEDVEEMRKALVEPLAVFLPMDRRQALFRGESLPDRASGAVLFADISGFTPLSAALAQEMGLRRGAEELTRLLNSVYEALIAQVHLYGGSVIGFSGDAITCWLGEDDGIRALACALSMQHAMAPLSSVATSAGTPVSLAIKVAVAAGTVRRFLTGDPKVQVLEVIAGSPLDELARAEHRAGRGEVVATEEVIERLGPCVQVLEWRTEDTGWRCAVVGCLTERVAPRPWPELPPEALPDRLCRSWLAPPVADRLAGGTKQFLAELRPAVALFLSFRGIDYEADDQAGQKLDAFVRWAQTIVYRQEGILVQLTVGDKGSYLYAAFGAPAAHGDDDARAVQTALALQRPPPELGFVSGIQVGVAKGRMRTGAYGSATQRTYGVLGDRTNLAARLMQAAAGGILCDEEVFLATHNQIAFESLPPIAVKGRTEPIPVYLPTREGDNAAPPETAVRTLIDRLAPPQQLVLKVASVAGSTFPAPLVRALLPDQSAADGLDGQLSALEEVGLIVRESARGLNDLEPRFTFRSAALQETAYDGMLFAQRRQLHRLAAEWYERTFSGDLSPHFASLAGHWRRAEEPAHAIDYLERASRLAQQAGDYEEAERLLQESLELESRAAVLGESFYEHPSVDWEGARRHALARLERDLPAGLGYHNLWHTRDDVLPAAQRLAALTGLGEVETRLVETAAAFHDTGYTVQREEHERLSAQIAGEALPAFGFSPAQVVAVQGMIMATQLPQSPRTLLEEIVADADLDVLGREDLATRNQHLRDELAASGTLISDERWFASQVQLLESHHYWTAAARSLRDLGKQRNLQMLRSQLRSTALTTPGEAPPPLPC
ncbi:MAG TPA: response regulator [Anaerolineae bacterium]|nr:response regulator [Anaerolineae bacterium]